MKIDVVTKTKKKSKFNLFFRKIKNFAEGVFFPANIKCIDCGRDLSEKREIELCDECLSKLNLIKEDKCCTLCGTRLNSSNRCLNCKNHKREFDLARSVCSYEGDIQKIIVGFKYNNKPYLSRTLGAMLASKFDDLKFDVDYAIFVPSTKKRLKSRGYNQAELLADEFSLKTGVPVCKEVLIKTKDTTRQAELGFKERQENLKKSFVVIDEDKVKDKNILVIDDVLTTGATANACALCLKNSGAKNVFVLTVASTPSKILTSGHQIPKKDK